MLAAVELDLQFNLKIESVPAMPWSLHDGAELSSAIAIATTIIIATPTIFFTTIIIAKSPAREPVIQT